jgi:hypothetical protein
MTTQQKLPPTFLSNYVFYDTEKRFKKMLDIEWHGQIKSSTDNKKFKIKYYGEILKTSYEGHLLSENGLIVGTDFAPALVFAVDIISGEEILLFDGCKHGYNAMFCDSYTIEQITNRPLANFYVDNFGFDIFEIVVKVYHNVDYADEFGDEINEKSGLETINGEILPIDILDRNGFDYFELILTNANGNEMVAITEELA